MTQFPDRLTDTYFCRNDNHVASIPRIVIDNNDIERVTQAKLG